MINLQSNRKKISPVRDCGRLLQNLNTIIIIIIIIEIVHEVHS